MTLGEKIQELRRRATMSQDALAEKLDVSRQAVSKWERDEAVPETDKIIRIAQVFGVSTDYLLLDAPNPPPYRQEPPRTHSIGDRIERFVRRHGYKTGYVLIGFGTFMCILALLVMILLPQLGAGFLDSARVDSDSWNSGVYVDGDVPQDVLDAIYNQAGSGMNSDYFGSGLFGSMEDSFNQQVEQMNAAWQGSVAVAAALFGIPVFLAGCALIVLGVIIVRKGKQIAVEAA